MEPQAIELGIPADKYWSMTFDEIMLQCSANKKTKERETKEKALFDYNMIRGLAYSFNKPEATPKFEEMYPMFDERTEEQKVIEQHSEVNQDLLNFLKLSENIKKNKK